MSDPAATACTAHNIGHQGMLAATPEGQTFSSGVAMWNGTETAEELIARADEALYRAKGSGRNCVLVA